MTGALPTFGRLEATVKETMRAVEIDLGQGQETRSMTHGTARAAGILRALEINNLDPDASAKSAKTAA